MPIIKEELFTKLDDDGEVHVREELADGSYGEKKIGLVQEWLRKKDQARENDQHSETLNVAKSATKAAWVAGIAAIISAIAALIAIFGSK